jgi:hypothetical protein
VGAEALAGGVAATATAVARPSALRAETNARRRERRLRRAPTGAPEDSLMGNASRVGE